MSEHDGGPAFPMNMSNSKLGANLPSGMTIRDYFAGQIITGCCAWIGKTPLSDTTTFTTASKFAYDLADAMLKARTQ